jgi:flagellar biosynthetic protein FliQ
VTEQQALDVAHNGVIVVLALAGPGLAVILAVGVVVSAFQAMTQINELTLSFLPKLAGLGLVLVILGPWMLQTMVNYTITMFTQLPSVVP